MNTRGDPNYNIAVKKNFFHSDLKIQLAEIRIFIGGQTWLKSVELSKSTWIKLDNFCLMSKWWNVAQHQVSQAMGKHYGTCVDLFKTGNRWGQF